MKNFVYKSTVDSQQSTAKNSLLVLLFAVTCSLFTLFATPVSAHVLETDGSIGAVMHIDPDDDPIAGEQASFFFEFKDKNNKFNPQNCECTFTITENNKQIYTTPLFQSGVDPSLQTASVFFTFPQKDVYQLKLSGSPLTPGAFQNFTLNYDVRVERVSNNPNASSNPSAATSQSDNFLTSHWPHFIIGGIIVIFLGWGIARQFKLKPKVNS